MIKNSPLFSKNRLRQVRDSFYKTLFYKKTYQLRYLKTPLFEHVLIQTTNQCTRKCTFCWYGMKDIEILDERMPEWLFRKIIDELVAINYTGRVSLFEMNEPLSDPRLAEWVQYVKQCLPNSWQMLTTNGDLLTEEKAQELIAKGVDFLNINSYSDPSYTKIKSLLKNLPRKLLNNISHTRSKAVDMGDNRGGNLPHIQTVPEPLKAPCSRVNHILYIKPSGKVVSCFGDYFNVNLLGNVKEQTVLEVWYGKNFETLRKHLNRSDRTISKLCRQCNLGAGTYFVTRKKQERELRENKIKTGLIIGASQSARLFYPAFQRYARISSVISKKNLNDPYFLERKVPLSEDLKKGLGEITLDFVFIANQNSDHYITAKQALLANKDVLIDKPMTVNVQQLDELIQLARSKDLLLGGIFQWRFLNMARLTKQWIHEGKLGDLLFINTRMLWNRDSSYYVRGRGTWKVDGGGVLIKQAIHCLDLMLYLGGTPIAWDGYVSNQTAGLETEDTAQALLQFTKGIGSLLCSTSYAKEMKPEVEIIGTKGKLAFNLRDEIVDWDLPFQRPFFQKRNIFAAQVQNFIESIDDPSKLLVTAEECRKSLVIIENIYQKSFPQSNESDFGPSGAIQFPAKPR